MKVLIVGLGSIARKHINALRKLYADCEIYAFRSGIVESKETEICNIFNWEELLQLMPFEFAIISNPTAEHAKTIKNLISLKCPLFIEKPVLSNLKDADELKDLLSRNNILTYVACNLRFHPCIQYIKDYLEKYNPVVQETNSYCGSYLPDWRPGKDFRLLYSAQKVLGGGVHLDLIHELDYILWVFGNPQKHTCFFNNQSELKIDAIDYAHYVLDYGRFFSTITINYFRRLPKRTFEIVTDKEVILVDLLNNKIIKNNEVIYSSDSGIIDTYTAQLEYFISKIKTKYEPMNNFSEAIETLKIALDVKIRK